jgi:hypothetical protein
MKNHNPYVGGIPDVWYSAWKDLWVEYKFLNIKKPRKDVIPDLSQLQIQWITRRQAEGRNVWVIVGYKQGGVIYKTSTEFCYGLTPSDFILRTQSRKELATEIYNFTKEPQNGKLRFTK